MRIQRNYNELPDLNLHCVQIQHFFFINFGTLDVNINFNVV